MDKIRLYIKENNKISQEATQYFEILNNVVEEANLKLREIAILGKCGIEVYSEYHSGLVHFCVRKNGAYWYYHVIHNGYIRQLTNCSWEVKLEMLNHLETLIQKIVESNQTKLNKLKDNLK